MSAGMIRTGCSCAPGQCSPGHTENTAVCPDQWPLDKWEGRDGTQTCYRSRSIELEWGPRRDSVLAFFWETSPCGAGRMLVGCARQSAHSGMSRRSHQTCHCVCTEVYDKCMGLSACVCRLGQARRPAKYAGQPVSRATAVAEPPIRAGHRSLVQMLLR